MEIWRDIAGYEGLYQVSNLGRVKSLNYRNTGKEKILKTCTERGGYLHVRLSKDGKEKNYMVHRLVLMNFNPIENMQNLEVNHIDENKENNKLSNLEWCNREYNINYGNRNKRASESNKGENHPMYGKHGAENPNSIPVVQLTLEGEIVNVYDSAKEAGKSGFTPSNINKCIKGKQKTHHGYKWEYLYQYIANIHPNIKIINLFGKEYKVNER